MKKLIDLIKEEDNVEVIPIKEFRRIIINMKRIFENLVKTGDINEIDHSILYLKSSKNICNDLGCNLSAELLDEIIKKYKNENEIFTDT